MRDSSTLAALARRQGGVFTREQAAIHGYSADAVTARLRSGAWQHYFPGHPQVLVAATTPATATSQAWASLFVVGQPGGLALDSAAALWGWCDPPPHVVVLTDHRRRPRSPDEVRLLRARGLPEAWSRREGLLLTDRARTLADCLRFLPRAQAQEILDRSQLRGGPRLAQVAALLPPHGRGSGQARLLLALADGTASEGERKLAAILRRAGLKGWQVNVRLRLRSMTVVVDFLFPEHHLVVEADGYAYHSRKDRFERDRRRQNALVNEAFKVLRFTYRQIVDEPDDVLATIVAALSH